jgi:hypothetical protein
MPKPRIDMQYVLDRTTIEEVIARYFQGLDRGLPDQVRSCFTDDVKTFYDGREPTSGIEAMMNSMSTFKSIAAGTLTATTHFMGNFNVQRIEGDAAQTETYAIAYLVPLFDTGAPIAMRSLRYLDRLRKADGEWRICARRHTLDWSCALQPKFAAALAQRSTDWP